MFLSGLETAKLLLLQVRKFCRAFVIIGQNFLTIVKKDIPYFNIENIGF